MKLIYFILSLIGLLLYSSLIFSMPANHLANQGSFACSSKTRPKVMKSIADWDIIATNVAHINAASAFTGDHLVFKLVAKPKNKKNLVTINPKTGKIRIQAEARDQFDVKVTANNHCGGASTSFNVLIDEEA